MAEPKAYLIERIRDQLLHDPLVGELDLHIVIDDGRVTITGNVGTADRRDAAGRIVAEACPDCEVRNETTVSEYPEAPDGVLP